MIYIHIFLHLFLNIIQVVPVPWLPKTGDGLSSKSMNKFGKEIGIERSEEHKDYYRNKEENVDIDDNDDVNTDDEVDWNAHPRIWGSWDIVHPAAMGTLSQRQLFPREHERSLFSGGETIHAASYSLYEPLTRKQAREKAAEVKQRKKAERKRKKQEEKRRKKMRAAEAKRRRAKKV